MRAREKQAERPGFSHGHAHEGARRIAIAVFAVITTQRKKVPLFVLLLCCSLLLSCRKIKIGVYLTK